MRDGWSNLAIKRLTLTVEKGLKFIVKVIDIFIELKNWTENQKIKKNESNERKKRLISGLGSRDSRDQKSQPKIKVREKYAVGNRRRFQMKINKYIYNN